MRPNPLLAPLGAVALLCACSESPPANQGEPVAAANSAAAAGPSVPREGPLSVYLGKNPFDPVDGTSFLEHDRVQSAVQVAVLNGDPRLWVFRRDATRTPVAMKDGRLLSHGCETGNCGGRNWTILIDPLGAIAEVCYAERGRASWYSGGRPPVPRDGGCPTE